MPFLSRRRMRFIGVKTIKHIVLGSAVGSSVATNVEVDIAEAVNSPALATPQEVGATARIRNIMLELNLTQTQANEDQIVDWYVAKKLPGQTLPNANSTGTSGIKNQIIQEGRECLGVSRNVVKRIGYIKVPPLLGRMNTSDKLVFVIMNPSADATNTWTFCAKIIYKELRT